MKKCYFALLFLLLFFPFAVRAENYGMEKFYMNVEVSENGDLVVEEFFQMNGTYNGFERIIHPTNPAARLFTGADEDFGGSSIYNAKDMVLSEVRGVFLDQINLNDNMDQNFEEIRRNSEVYQKIAYESTRKKGVYTHASDHIKIYNNDKNTGFYLKYTLSDMAILHTDVAEFGWNIFSDEMRESIKDFKVLIHLPNNQNELRAFAHGPLNGNINLQSKTSVLLSIQGFDAKQAIDTRIVFDKEVIPLSNKKTEIIALDKILKYEGEMAEDANAKREQARQQLEMEKRTSYIIAVVSCIFALGIFVFAIVFYFFYDKEFKPVFKAKYFRDFPSDLGPEMVGYLVNRNITTNDLSAAILNLIYKKKITYEKLEKDYKFILSEAEIPLTPTDEETIAFLFDGQKEIKMSEFKKKASKGYTRFLHLYEHWFLTVSREAQAKNFFVSLGKIKIIAFIYFFLGGFFLFMTLSETWFPVVNIIVIIIDFIFLFYILLSSKRTKYGNEEYHKWIGLKNFMNDFGKFESRELPQIELWEKYMVYAVTFGIAKKLSKEMKIRIQDASFYSPMTYDNYDFFTDMLVLNSVVHDGVVSATEKATATAASVASSSSSSSGGFGGGFSSGGGSFGGGGGGGRF